jgi:hypothetical protein
MKNTWIGSALLTTETISRLFDHFVGGQSNPALGHFRPGRGQQ